MTTTSTEMKRRAGVSGKAAPAGPLSADEVRKMDAYWRASNYLSVGQIYLLDNPLVERAAQARAHQAAIAGPLGHVAWSQHALRASQSRHQAR